MLQQTPPPERTEPGTAARSATEDEDIAIIESAKLFDAAWYISEYADVASCGMDPLVHYVRHGADEGRLPFATFGAARYLETLPEGDALNRNILAHYIAGREKISADRISEADAKALLHQQARSRRPRLSRQPIDFTPKGEAAITAIVVLYNQLDLTLTALDSLQRNAPGGIDLILVDSGSTDQTRHIERYVTGARILRFEKNIGFIEACNAVIGDVQTQVTLFLNNDIQLETGAIAAVLQRFATTPDAGAVGGKVIRANGLLQEAGCIIWRDGTTTGYLRNGDPNQPEANFVREVDFCSGVFLGVRTRLLQDLGGFDGLFKPAYFEDSDLCLRIAAAGFKTFYDPAITITHLEHSSSDPVMAAMMMAQNLPKFQQKHAAHLASRYPRHPDLLVHARGTNTLQQKILFIEDRLPLRHLGSGYTRSNDIICAMAALGHQVTVFPVHRTVENILEIYRDFPDTVELIHDRELSDLQEFAGQRSGFYDTIWISRTHNAERLAEIILQAQRHLPMKRIILDTEAVAAMRQAGRQALQSLSAPQMLAPAVERELAPARFCRKIIAVSQQDAGLIRDAGFPDIETLGHMRHLRPTPLEFAKRRDLLFVGAIHERDAPNLDALEWFVEAVLPLLQKTLPRNMRFSIAGHCNRRIDLCALARSPRVRLLGPVDDLTVLYNSHRLFVAPTRFAGGIPYKLHEAASFGLPIVASSLLCQQVGWTEDVEILGAETGDAAAFAAQIQRGYRDAGLWRRLRSAALARLQAENDPTEYQHRIDRILQALDQNDRAAELAPKPQNLTPTC